MTRSRRTSVIVTAVALTAVVGLAGALGAGVRVVTVASDSMAPTLAPGDHLVMVPPWGGVDRRDLVVLRPPGSDVEVVKRVVAVAGDEVGIADGALTVDGAVLDEPFVDVAADDGTYFGPVTVPAGAVFVLGDNRTDSLDSRQFGPVPVARVVGVVAVRLPS